MMKLLRLDKIVFSFSKLILQRLVRQFNKNTPLFGKNTLADKPLQDLATLSPGQ
jgi:hypothetical protein